MALMSSPPPMPRPMPIGGPAAPGTAMGTGGPMGLASILGALQAPQAPDTPYAQTTFPDQPRTLNPQFIQLILQAMMGAQGQTPPGLKIPGM